MSLDICLKEWAAVVGALSCGRQILLLRKGGIAEKKGEFQVSHKRFWLYPTFEHQRADLIRPEERHFLEEAQAGHVPGKVRISHYADVAESLEVKNFSALSGLWEEHIWTQDYLKMRADYKPEKPLMLLALRVFHLNQPRILEETPRYAGCRSWVALTEPLAIDGAEPVIQESEFEKRRRRILEVFSEASARS